MRRKFIIVGGLLTPVAPEGLLERLKNRTLDEAEWDWLYTPPPKFSLSASQRGAFGALLHEHRTNKSGEPPSVILKLKCLHRNVADQLISAVADAKLVPKSVVCEDDLFDWIFSVGAGLFPPVEWHGNAHEAAFCALVAKLLRNKSFNKDQRGHNWTKEEDLLNQAPVMLPDHPEIRAVAENILASLRGSIFLTKGSGQGATPKEWCINSVYLYAVKQMIMARCLASDSLPGVEHVFASIRSDTERPYRIDGRVVSEHVFQICQQRE